MEFKLEKILMNHNIVNQKLRWKQIMMKKFWIIRNYLMKIILWKWEKIRD